MKYLNIKLELTEYSDLLELAKQWEKKKGYNYGNEENCLLQDYLLSNDKPEIRNDLFAIEEEPEIEEY